MRSPHRGQEPRYFLCGEVMAPAVRFFLSRTENQTGTKPPCGAPLNLEPPPRARAGPCDPQAEVNWLGSLGRPGLYSVRTRQQGLGPGLGLGVTVLGLLKSDDLETMSLLRAL